jgi:hypothetical protein
MKNPIKQFTSYLVFISALLLLLNQSCAKQETVLSVEAALVFKSGDIKPVARTEFFLLDKNFETILQEAGFISSISASDLPQKLKDSLNTMNGINPLGTFSAVIKLSNGIVPYQIALAKVAVATKSHTVYTTTTDFQGKAQFKEIKAGEYYLFGYNKVGESVAVWNLKTEVKSGQNSITLDQNNAEITN